MANTVYLSDPFEGGINTGDASGLKFYIIPTADRKKEELITISQENVTKTMSTFRHNSNSFDWRIVTNNITRSVGDPLRILEDFQAYNLTLVRQEAAKTWHDYAGTTHVIAFHNVMA